MAERKVSPASLENLKLGAIARWKGKVRVTVTILPQTKEWLAHDGNVSERIDELNRVHLENCSSILYEKKKPSSPSPFSQIWEKGSRKVVPLPLGRGI
jgi:hypothetical protein